MSDTVIFYVCSPTYTETLKKTNYLNNKQSPENHDYMILTRVSMKPIDITRTNYQTFKTKIGEILQGKTNFGNNLYIIKDPYANSENNDTNIIKISENSVVSNWGLIDNCVIFINNSDSPPTDTHLKEIQLSLKIYSKEKPKPINPSGFVIPDEKPRSLFGKWFGGRINNKYSKKSKRRKTISKRRKSKKMYK